MDVKLKLILSYLLGEIYDLKNQIVRTQDENNKYSRFLIDALKSGNEHIINQELGLKNEYSLSEERYYEIKNVLNDLATKNHGGFENINGFYDLPLDIQNLFSRDDWFLSFQTMKHEGAFSNLLSRIEGSVKSPTEFSSFD